MCRFRNKIVVDTELAAADAAAAINQGGVDFVFGDKRSMWQFCGGLRDNGLREGKRLKAGAKTIHAAMSETQETLVCVFILGLGIIPRHIILKIMQIVYDSVNFIRRRQGFSQHGLLLGKAALCRSIRSKGQQIMRPCLFGQIAVNV